VVDDTLAQMALISTATRDGRALRARFDSILGTHPSLNRELASRLAGLATAFQPESADEHPLTGQRVPDLELQEGPASSVFALLRTARFVLLDLTGGRLRLDAGGRYDGLDVVAARLAEQPLGWESVNAVLIRPDGHIAWATDNAHRESEQAPAALAQWLSPERAPMRTGVRSTASGVVPRQAPVRR
jgi:hypothetical protein